MKPDEQGQMMASACAHRSRGGNIMLAMFPPLEPAPEPALEPALERATSCATIPAMRHTPLITAIMLCAGLAACTPPPPVAFDGFDGLKVAAVTAAFGPPDITSVADTRAVATWHLSRTVATEVPFRHFRNGIWQFGGFRTQTYLISCEYRGFVEDDRITRGTLTGARQACDEMRDEAAKVGALLDIVRSEVDEARQNHGTPPDQKLPDPED